MPSLNWLGKEAVINHHQQVPYKTLELAETFGCERGKSGNKIIHGDNLEALKALLPEYEGRVKCIYIDPPYNTGNEGWIYNDNVNSPKIRKWLGQTVGKEAEDLTRHDKWLCMMYPRLKLLHKLLKEDGAIFISIDDNEQANLKLICDEIFGSGNFVGNICHKSRSSVSNDLILSSNHNLILFYAKKYEKVFSQRRSYRLDAEEDSFKYDDNDGKGKYKLVPVDGPGGAIKGNPYYEFLGVVGYWRYNKETMQMLYDKGEILKRKHSLSRKYYLSKAIEKGGKSLTTWWDDVGSATNGTNLLKSIFGNKIFDTPKPLELVERIVKIATEPSSIILDSFAGSGTTAHAVLNLNKSDGGNRKFILVEMEDYAESITAERVRRVIKGYGEGKNSVEGTGGDFNYYELGPEMLIDGNINENQPVENIRNYIYYTETNSLVDAHAARENGNEYFLGCHENTAYYLFYKRAEVTTLDAEFLGSIGKAAERYVIYADNCVLSKDFLFRHGITFKKIPRDVRKF